MKTQLLLIGLFFLLHFGANAQCGTDQSQLLTDAGRSARNLPGYYEGQTFTAGATGLLCEIDMLMFNTMAGTGTLNIYSGTGISGTVLNTQIVNVSVPSMTNVWQNWTITTPPAVTAGQVYTFQFIPAQGGGLPDPYGVNVLSNDVYSGGYDLGNTNGELTFRTYVDVTTGTNDIHGQNNYVVYPNPFSLQTTLQTDKILTDATVTVYNSFGQQVKQIINISGQTITLSRDKLSSGVYFIRLIQDNYIIMTDKLVIKD
ncbi:MAG TPA: T9SS type A sorting domain-containing protein [Bacteroidales bacterium]|nr:T9SS type A sorting domain-containing protein [Bacteroidales bacterium]